MEWCDHIDVTSPFSRGDCDCISSTIGGQAFFIPCRRIKFQSGLRIIVAHSFIKYSKKQFSEHRFFYNVSHD